MILLRDDSAHHYYHSFSYSSLFSSPLFLGTEISLEYIHYIYTTYLYVVYNIILAKYENGRMPFQPTDRYVRNFHVWCSILELIKLFRVCAINQYSMLSTFISYVSYRLLYKYSICSWESLHRIDKLRRKRDISAISPNNKFNVRVPELNRILRNPKKVLRKS